MESFKQLNEKKQGEMRPHGGYRSIPLKIVIPKKKVEEEEKEEPITPGSDYVDHFKPLEDVDYDGEYY